MMNLPQPSIAESDGNLADRSVPEEALFALVEATTGFPKETLTHDSRLLDDLNLDSIKSGDLIARYAELFGLAGELDPAQWTNASLGEIVDLIAHRLSDHTVTARENQLLNDSDVLQALMEHISSTIDIPTSDISADALIGPDLNIDAEAFRQLLMAISNTLKFDLNLDIEPLLDRSPAQIANIFTRIANAGKNTNPLSTINFPHTSVRELRIDVIESERPKLPSWYGKRTEDQWIGAQVLILGDEAQDSVCLAIERQVTRLGGGVQVETFDTVQSQAVKETVDNFSHFIAVLPHIGKNQIHPKTIWSTSSAFVLCCGPAAGQPRTAPPQLSGLRPIWRGLFWNPLGCGVSRPVLFDGSWPRVSIWNVKI
jgi:enediyne polyketide synthase